MTFDRTHFQDYGRGMEQILDVEIGGRSLCGDEQV